MNIDNMNSSVTGFAAIARVLETHKQANAATSADGSQTIDTANNSAATKDTVNISQAGRDAFKYDSGNVLREQAKAKRLDSEKATDSSDKAPIDEQIERIQDQIEALNKQLAKLKGDDSEAAEQQRKLISSQIMALNSELATLVDKKVREAKAS